MLVDPLLPFQKAFMAGAFAAGVRTAVLSLPRGNGKSCLGAHILSRCLSPGDVLHESGKEYLLVASSLEQARCTYGFIRETLEATGQYRWLDSSTRIGVTHKASNTRLRVLSSKGKSAFGLVNSPLLVFDEPGALEVVGGQLLSDAVFSAQGKPNSTLRVIMLGTLSPASSGWWHDIVKGGSSRSVFVQSLMGDPSKWDKWSEIKRCNPLMATFAESRGVLRDERDEARRDPRLKARFCSYRLNRPSMDESTTLLTVDDWQNVLKRAVPERAGKPIIGLDIGQSRAWSAAVALWRSGRVEVLALAPGAPSLADQEKRDRVASGTYSRLVSDGTLHVADGLRVPPVGLLVGLVTERWGRPAVMLCDRFRLPELMDCAHGFKVIPRASRWSEASFDIRSLRAMACDGDLSVEDRSRAILTASLAATVVKNDDGGNVRMVKDSANCGRDDVSAALLLACGAAARSASSRPRKVYLGKV